MRNIINLFNVKKDKKEIDYFIIGKVPYFIVKYDKSLNMRDYYLFHELSLFFNTLIIFIDKEEELFDLNIDDFFDLLICFKSI